MMSRILVPIMLFILSVFTCTERGLATKLQEFSGQRLDVAGDTAIVKGLDGWLFLKEELQHVRSGKFWGPEAELVSRTKNKKYADPLPEIVAYDKLLKEKGITLYLMPVPPKVLVYPEKLDPELTGGVAEDVALYQEFLQLLEESGVRSINLLPILLEKKDKAQLYCKTDSHYSGEGLLLFADAAAEVIKKEAWYQDVPKTAYQSKEQKISIHGDLLQMSGEESGGEELILNLVNGKESGEPVKDDRKSPVILLGDSHTLVFSAGGDLHAKGAGLFDHLSAQLGFGVDLLGVRGSGVTPARIKLYQRSKTDAEYLKGKKVLIWCFTARDFTGIGGFKKIPVAP